MTSPDVDESDEPEVGAFSLWFMRGALLVTALAVLGFLLHAVFGLFDGDRSGDAGALGDVLASTSTTAPPVTAEEPESDAADGDDADDEAAPSAPTTSESPTTGSDAEVDTFVAEAVQFIEQTRGRPFLEPPDLRVIGETEFLDILVADLDETFAEEPDLVEKIDVLYQALGMIGPDESIEQVYKTFVEAGVLGVYFPDRDEMLVRGGGPLTLLAKATIVHELVHAYDDQHFDLERGDDLDGSTELQWTFAAAVEGSARYVETLWVDGLSVAEQDQLSAEELAFGDPDLLLSIDFAFLFQEISVYEYGEAWVARLVERDGIEAIDDAVLNPTATSEQVMEPLDASGLAPIAVAPPAVDGEVIWQLAGGQVLVDSLLKGAFLPTEPGVTGWGGDAITAYRSEGRSCIRWDIATDSATDAAELRAALEDWVRFRRSGRVTVVDDLVRVDRCA